MKILLKDIKITNYKNEKSDILINNELIEKISKQIEYKDADFTFYLEERLVTLPLLFTYPRPVKLLEGYKNLISIVLNGVKTGYTNYIFNIEGLGEDAAKNICDFFSTNYLKGLFLLDNNINYKYNDFVYFQNLKSLGFKNEKDIEKYFSKIFKIPKKIEEREEASIIIWDTKNKTDILNSIPYIIVSKGKIIYREGRFIFSSILTI